MYRLLGDACPAEFEVLSRRSRLFDTQVKRERLERTGCPCFWVVDPMANPADARVVAWEIGMDRRYREIADVRGEEAFVAKLPFEVTVIPANLVR
jgi:hypothetical protein